ncbi:hypothetical protein K1719_005427 [Acacia pycnantha]|nr:hypothetical protein K1719_005427 [Acacia pycnantha]
MDHDHDDNNGQMFNQGGGSGGGSCWEIEELEMSLEVAAEVEEECVYVGVGKSETSMEALSWTLKHLITSPSTMLYLIHVFPEIKYIPNPLGMGMIPKNQVSAETIESFEAQERAKRRQLLSKFHQLCSSSQIKVDTILIESSDTVAKAILELVPILNIQNLVIGTNKSRKSKSRKGKNGIAEQILQNVADSCRVRIISEGKEVNQQMLTMMSSPSPSVATSNSNYHNDNHQIQTLMPMKEDQDHLQNVPVSCHCFLKPTFK